MENAAAISNVADKVCDGIRKFAKNTDKIQYIVMVARNENNLICMHTDFNMTLDYASALFSRLIDNAPQLRRYFNEDFLKEADELNAIMHRETVYDTLR